MMLKHLVTNTKYNFFQLRTFTHKRKLPVNTHQSIRTTRSQNFGRRSLRQRGYSIIELSIALAILAVIIIGGLLGVQTILRNNRTNEVLKNVPSYMANAAKITASQQALTFTTANLADLGVWPAERLAGASPDRTVTHEHGGRIFLVPNTAVAGVAGVVPIGQSFVLTLAGIPEQSCADIAAGVDAVSIQTAVQVTPAAPIAVTAIPAAGVVKAAGAALNLGNLAAACGAAGNKNIIAVIVR